MIKTIVTATDGSEHARRAVQFAIDFAKRYEARLVVAHVLLRDASPQDVREVVKVEKLPKAVRDELDRVTDVPLAAASMGGGYVPAPIPKSVLEAVAERLLADVQKAAEKAGVSKFSSVVLEGPPAQRILELVQQEKADVVVMGRRGMGAVAGLVLGSVSNKVASRAECTCITVK